MNKKHIVILILVFAITFYGASSSLAKTVYCSNCSDRFTQALERATSLDQLRNLANSYAEDIKQTAHLLSLIQNNIDQLNNMVHNTNGLSDSLLNQAKQDLTALARITGSLNTYRGDVTAMSDIFNILYPSIDDIGNILVDPNISINDAWTEWAKASDIAAQAVFQVSGQQLEDLSQNSAALDRHIDDLLRTPEGQMQALQAANNLSSLQIEEMRKLRELMSTATQAAIMAQMKEEKSEQLAKEIWQEMHKTDKLKKQYEDYQ